MTDVREALFVARTSDGRTVRRPLSPHLQIYKPQLTSGLSIFHRITGVILMFGTMLLVWWLVAAATSDDAFALVSALLHSWFGKLALIVWTAALWYHFCNGIRHLAWDAGYGFEISQVHASGRFLLISVASLTALTVLLGFLAL